MSTAYEQLVTILTKLHDAPPELITPEATFGQLDVDSMTMVEISLHIERELGVPIGDDELQDDRTLGETADLIESRQA